MAEITLEELPVPSPFIPDTLKSYDCPLRRPATVAEVVVDTPSVKVVHVVGSEDSLYSTL